MDTEVLARVEEQRLSLEDNIAKLRGALRHWQTLEIDYEGLKEEFLGLPESASPQQCLQAAKSFRPELVDDKELESLVGNGVSVSKTPSQLVDVLTKRTEYVYRNVETIRKQISDAEKKRNALLLAERPEYQDDAGLPLREITEELDEDGNVISSKVQAPGAQSSELTDVLRRAGVAGLDEITQTTDASQEASVVAAEEIKTGAVSEDLISNDLEFSPDSASRSHAVKSSIVRSYDDTISSEESTRPPYINDTAEEAALRQEMLEYSLNEVGNIVAELEIEDMKSSLPYDNHGSDDEDELDSQDDDEDLYSDQSEDERGMLKRPVISDRYREKMEELERRLGIKDMKNLGPEPDLPGGVKEQLPIRPSPAEAARKAAIARYDASKSSLKSHSEDPSETKAEKKRVVFSEDLDIAPEIPKPSLATPSGSNAMGEQVIERTNDNDAISTPSTPAPPRASVLPKKISKFKAARTKASEVPTFPPSVVSSQVGPSQAIVNAAPPAAKQDQIMAKTLIERETDPKTAAPDPIDFDEELHKREIATEYQQMRNRRIHSQGGYVGAGEQDNYGDEFSAPHLEDEITGKSRKVSRFKAARLRSEAS